MKIKEKSCIPNFSSRNDSYGIIISQMIWYYHHSQSTLLSCLCKFPTMNQDREKEKVVCFPVFSILWGAMTTRRTVKRMKSRKSEMSSILRAVRIQYLNKCGENLCFQLLPLRFWFAHDSPHSPWHEIGEGQQTHELTTWSLPLHHSHHPDS